MSTHTVYIYKCDSCGVECRVLYASDCPDECLICGGNMCYDRSEEVEDYDD